MSEYCTIQGRGVVCLKFNLRNCRDVDNVFMENGAFTNSIYPDESPHNAMSQHGLHYSPCLAHSWCNVTVNNIKSPLQDTIYLLENA